MERQHNVIELPPIQNPTREQLSHFLAQAAFLDWVAEIGGMSAAEAIDERSRVLKRIGMVKFPEEKY